jgi:hypothetical protein
LRPGALRHRRPSALLRHGRHSGTNGWRP